MIYLEVTSVWMSLSYQAERKEQEMPLLVKIQANELVFSRRIYNEFPIDRTCDKGKERSYKIL